MCTWQRSLAASIARAYVTDGTMGFDEPEVTYRDKGYQPDYDALPRKEAYDAAEAAKKAKQGDNA
jgi:hypothetical protein